MNAACVVGRNLEVRATGRSLSTRWRSWLRSVLGLAAAASVVAAADDAQLKRGQELYLRHCLACHQMNGEGIPDIFPPLAGSDYLLENVDRSVRAVVAGLSGEIVVNGRRYSGMMPPIVISDAEVADIFTYVLNSWGNPGGEVTPEQVRRVRARTRFPTFEALKSMSEYAPLPPAPEGFTLREVARLNQRGVRLVSDGKGETLFVLSETGDVSLVDIASGEVRPVLSAARYLERRPGDLGPPVILVGMTRDVQGRLYIVSNQQNEATLPAQNIVTIYRTTRFVDGLPTDPTPWFQTSYPGNGRYLHGAEAIAFGPDGMLYVSNGARTDGNETTNDPKWYAGGETPVTAAIWRLDPRAQKPEVEIYARGIRNAYAFCWNEEGEMFATENGPDAHAPEELNLIEQGRHYGFPYTFADWGTRKAYPHTPDAPPGLEFTLPIPNFGPDGGFDGQPIYSMEPHSSPAGIAYLGDDFPPAYRRTFVIARFGNLLRLERDTGFDVVHVALTRDADGRYRSNVRTFLAPLGRPIDVHVSGRGRLYVLEYSRGTTNAAGYALPGRILELAAQPSVRSADARNE